MATNGNDGATRKFAAEVDLVLSSNPDIAIAPATWREDGVYSYLYRKGEYLVADRDLDRALRVLGKDVEVVDNLVVGVTLLRGSVAEVNPLLTRVDAELGAGVVTPNHVLSVCPKGAGLCPATEPGEKSVGKSSSGGSR